LRACVEKKILYFASPGPHNTMDVLKAVKKRLDEDDIKHVVVASVSGETALRIAEALKNLKVRVVCVSGFPGWLSIKKEYPFVEEKFRKKLERLGVAIVDKTPSSMSDTIDYGLARYGYVPASWVMAETLETVGGYGLKTAVEAILMATDSGITPAFREAISVAGTDKGADTAIVAKSTFSSSVFSSDANRRFQILEIIAMPKAKKWYKTIGVGGHTFKEIERGETLDE